MTGSIIQRAKNMVPLLVPLFISAFRRADELAIAMEARCYRGGVNRTRMKELQVTYVDYIGCRCCYFGYCCTHCVVVAWPMRNIRIISCL